MKATEKQMANLRQYLFVPGCHLQTSMGKMAQRTLDSRREVSRSRREVSTIVGNESGDCRPPRSPALQVDSLQSELPGIGSSYRNQGDRQFKLNMVVEAPHTEHHTAWN
jgi:hypothetical protein